MKYQAFSIRLGSLHFPLSDSDADVLKPSSRSMELLNDLYQTLNEKIVGATNVQNVAKSLEGNLFCCCLEEGMAMLRCTASTAPKGVRLDGFLVTKESLRTAWRLVRWKLLFVCAGGWEHHGFVSLTPAEIEQMALSLRASQETQKKLIEMSQKMIASDVPFSFAVTDLRPKQLPLQFPQTVAVGNPAVTEDARSIDFSVELAKSIFRQRAMEIPIYCSLMLCHDTKKHYQSERLRYVTFENPKELKSSLKDDMAQYPMEEIWYFQAKAEAEFLDYTLKYLHPLSQNACNHLNHGYIDFSELDGEVYTFIKHYEKYLAVLKKEQKRQEEEQHQEEAREPAPPEKRQPRKSEPSNKETPEKSHGGFFKNLFPKK